MYMYIRIRAAWIKQQPTGLDSQPQIIRQPLVESSHSVELQGGDHGVARRKFVYHRFLEYFLEASADVAELGATVAVILLRTQNTMF